jgi:hypothetical protein
MLLTYMPIEKTHVHKKIEKDKEPATENKVSLEIGRVCIKTL